MALNLVTQRITSKDIYIEFLPFNIAVETHIQHLYFDAAVDGGTFKLWVNGEETAAITMTGTAATDIAAINSALDALPNLTAGDIVASGTVITDITLTAAGDGFYRIELVDGYDTTLTQTVPNSNLKVTSEVTTQGSDWVRISEEMSTMDWEEAGESVDVTGISEEARIEIPVARAVSGSISVFKTRADTTAALTALPVSLIMPATGWGTIRVFPEGKIVGKEYTQFRILIDNFSESYPDHDKVENEISFQRQGDWVARPHSIWRG